MTPISLKEEGGLTEGIAQVGNRLSMLQELADNRIILEHMLESHRRQ